MNHENYFDINQKRWNELVDINAKSKSYDLEGFKQGKTSLLPIEIEEVGNVSKKSLLHLQCHFGMDTLSWARLGAKVTGVDFSNKAIELARKLSNELEIPAEFIESNIYNVPSLLNKKFDIVFTSYGVLCWLPDLYKWAEIIGNFLKPGGIFYIIEGHPFGTLVDEHYQKRFKIGYNYFNQNKPLRFEDDMSYASTDKKIQNKDTYEWFHPMSEIINSLIIHGLELEFLHEFPFGFFQIHPDMQQRDDGYWEFQTFEFSISMLFSLRAKKK
jgi:SAM-dependent methyltransferase